MRTSRIARDTARVLSATRTHRQTKSRQNGSSNTETVKKVQNVKDDLVDVVSETSELSELPSSPMSNGPPEKERRAESRKRKRGEDIIAVKIDPEQEATKKITKPPSQPRRPPTKKKPPKDFSTEAPANWEETYALTRQMRDENPAPVDTMGCESLADKTMSPRDQRFQTLVALMLSSQTKDTVTAVAIKNMQENIPGGFTLSSLLTLPAPSLNALISKVGFHNLKTSYIKQTAVILATKFDSDIPRTVADLISLPGVGPKMAYLTMSAAWDRDEGIGVDVHVHRITNLWGWHRTAKPEETRAALESWLPRERWHDINNLLVGFGQTICLPVGRRCWECKLAERGLCPSAVKGGAAMKKKKSVVKVEVEVDGGDVKTEAIEEMVIKTEEAPVGVADIEDCIPPVEPPSPKRILRKRPS